MNALDRPLNCPRGTFPEKLADVERIHVFEVMQRYGGNKVETARALGIATATLYRKLIRYGWVYSKRGLNEFR